MIYSLWFTLGPTTAMTTILFVFIPLWAMLFEYLIGGFVTDFK